MKQRFALVKCRSSTFSRDARCISVQGTLLLELHDAYSTITDKPPPHNGTYSVSTAPATRQLFFSQRETISASDEKTYAKFKSTPLRHGNAGWIKRGGVKLLHMRPRKWEYQDQSFGIIAGDLRNNTYVLTALPTCLF